MAIMLGIRLGPDEEEALARYARAVGRPKSVLAREWIREGLQRQSLDSRIGRDAETIARHESRRSRHGASLGTGAFLRMLDERDGGYDWGPEGPPE